MTGTGPTPFEFLSRYRVTTADVRVAVPSAIGLRSLRCGPPVLEDETGALAGGVRTRSGHPLPEALVLLVRWKGNADTDPMQEGGWEAETTLDPSGAFFLCGLPVDKLLTVHVEGGGLAGEAGPIELTPDGIGRLLVTIAPVPPER